MKKIAIIGSGISGISSAYYLTKLGFDVELFESGSYFGGHTNTVDITLDSTSFPVDTGFLVHNDRTYPHLIDFFSELQVQVHPSDMSFSVVQKRDNLTWCGTNLFTVFAQKRNLISPRFYRFLSELLRFNKNAPSYLKESEGNYDLTLGELLDHHHYSEDFRHWYLLPMGGCIWSTPTQGMLKFPAYTFLVFCMNHGLLQVFDHPQWKTLVGGCRTYVEKALRIVPNKRLNTPVHQVIPNENGVIVKTAHSEMTFDYALFCTHPPETVKMLSEQNLESKDVLRNFSYQPNTAIVHTDESILPKHKNAWAAWNYLADKQSDGQEAVSVSYLINKLQPLPVKQSVIVTLNPLSEIKDELIHRSIYYEHPLFDSKAIRAQPKVQELQGENNLFFAGAWMRYGFHEDGIWSAKQAIQAIVKKSEHSSELLRVI